MRPLFADTFYWIALLNRREAWYSRVVALSRTLGTRSLLTTEWVLAEFLAEQLFGRWSLVLHYDLPAPSGEPLRQKEGMGPIPALCCDLWERSATYRGGARGARTVAPT